MILKKLSVINYRNIGEASICLSPKFNCFVGNNGAGKTNILDAVYYLSFCRSSHNPVDSQVIKHGQDFFVIDAEYADDHGDPMAIYCGMKRGQKKRVKRDGKEYKRLSEHIGLIPIVMVEPSDIMLIEGQSEERRKLMDMVIAQYDRTYLNLLNQYNRALQQRNMLLKQMEQAGQQTGMTVMAILEEQMATAGEDIFRRRDDFVKRLMPIFQRYYSHISADNERVGLEYMSHCQRGPLIDVIQRDRMKDLAVGYSLHGVHRDDLSITIDNHPMRREGSQGQNKTYVISLKLAQFELLRKEATNAQPMLLLDDIFDKLDAERVGRIVQLVSTEDFGQVFITDTNRLHLDKILVNHAGCYSIFEVENGVVKTNVE